MADETLKDVLHRKADLGICVDHFTGDEVTPENMIKIQRRMLHDYIPSLPVGFVQVFETSINRFEQSRIVKDISSYAEMEKRNAENLQKGNANNAGTGSETSQPDSGSAADTTSAASGDTPSRETEAD